MLLKKLMFHRKRDPRVAFYAGIVMQIAEPKHHRFVTVVDIHYHQVRQPFGLHGGP